MNHALRVFFISALLLTHFGLPDPRPRQDQQTIQVPRDSPTIAAGLAAAGPGDTVEVASGLYYEGMLSIPDGVILKGAGRDTTVIDAGGADVVVYPSPGSTVEGFTLQGSGPDYFNTAVWITRGDVIVRNNRLINNGTGLWAWCFASDCGVRVLIEGNLIEHNLDSGLNSNAEAIFTVRSNTIAYNGAQGMVLNNPASLVENNIVFENKNWGIANQARATVRYNDLWNNQGNYSDGSPGEGNLSLDPMFLDPVQGNYHLRAGSPAVRNGYPAGTAMGALAFSPVGNPPTGLHVDRQGEFEWTIAWDGSDGVQYSVYWGTQPGLYSHSLNAGSNPSAVLASLPGNLRYYAAVSSQAGPGEESAVSDEISFFVPPLTPETYEETSPALELSGSWTRIADERASGQGYLASDTPGDSLSFTFFGDTLALYRLLNLDGGQAVVQIDGEPYGTLDFYFQAPRWQTPAVYDHLGNHTHTFTLTVDHAAASSSTGHRVAVDAIAIPSPFEPDDSQQRAVQRVNEYRQQAGIPLAQGVEALHLGAQAHAEFLANNQSDPRLAGLGFHQEQPDLPGFLGTWPSDRAHYFGYSGSIGEDGHFLGDPIRSVDDWMATVYHRNLILCWGCVDIGYGRVHTEHRSFDALNMGSRTSPHPETRQVFTYPGREQVDVPVIWWGGEAPDPLPDKPRPVGYPVSLYIAQADAAALPAAVLPPLGPISGESAAYDWQVDVAELSGPDGIPLPIYILEQNVEQSNLGPDQVFLIAEAPLAFQTRYTAHVAGLDSRGLAFDQTWSFTTLAAARVIELQIDPQATRADITWRTAGEATTTIRYGLTPASYGPEIDGEQAPSEFHSVVLYNLKPGTYYYFKIISHDSTGTTLITEDQSFLTQAAPGAGYRQFLPSVPQTQDHP